MNIDISKNKRPAVLMPVFNTVDNDGRVQRAAEALSDNYDITVFAIDSGRNYFNPKFKLLAVRSITPKRFKIRQHLAFWWKLLRANMRIRPDIIHAHDFFMAFPGWLAARLCRARLVYDAHELYIPEPGIKMSPRDKFWYRLEKIAIRFADMVIAANEDRARIMVKHYRLKTMPLVIRNIPPSAVSIMSDEKVFSHYPEIHKRVANEFLCVYQGDISLDRGIGDYINALKTLPENYRLILVGGGPDFNIIKNKVSDPALNNKITLIGKVPKDHLYDILRQCDLGIITYSQTGLNNLYCAPNKLFEYAQAGLASICSPNPTLAKIFAEYPVGITCAVDEISVVIQYVATKKSEFVRIIPDFLKKFNWENESKCLMDVYFQYFGE